MKFVDPLELEGAQFRNNTIHLRSGGNQINQRVADVPPHKGLKTAGPKNLSGQGGCGRLAVGAGNGDQWRVNKAARQFDLADYLALPGARQLERL